MNNTKKTEEIITSTEHTSCLVENPELIKDTPDLIMDSLKPFLEEEEKIHGLLPIKEKPDAYLVFTELRILYIDLPEFQKKGRFYSYPYETLKSLMIRERISNPSIEKRNLWYLIDYTSNDIILVEVFSDEDVDFIKKQMDNISTFREIPMVDKKYSHKKFNNFVNNPELAIEDKRKTSMAFVLIAILLIFALVIRRM